MTTLGVVKRNIPRPAADLVARLSKLGVATVHEAMGRTGLAHPVLAPIYDGALACGPAVTVLLQPGDNWMLHVAAELIQPGDVVIAACNQRQRPMVSSAIYLRRLFVRAAAPAWSLTVACAM